MKKLLFLLPAVLFLAACPAVQDNARDAAASLNGVITSAQAQNQASCIANGTQAVCTLINRGVAAQNALITAEETYCGWSTTAPPPDPNAVCVPVKGAEAALNAAIANATELTTEIKAVVK
jgi:hypothetical protein